MVGGVGGGGSPGPSMVSDGRGEGARLVVGGGEGWREVERVTPEGWEWLGESEEPSINGEWKGARAPEAMFAVTRQLGKEAWGRVVEGGPMQAPSGIRYPPGAAVRDVWIVESMVRLSPAILAMVDDMLELEGVDRVAAWLGSSFTEKRVPMVEDVRLFLGM